MPASSWLLERLGWIQSLRSTRLKNPFPFPFINLCSFSGWFQGRLLLPWPERQDISSQETIWSSGIFFFHVHPQDFKLLFFLAAAVSSQSMVWSWMRTELRLQAAYRRPTDRIWSCPPALPLGIFLKTRGIIYYKNVMFLHLKVKV